IEELFINSALSLSEIIFARNQDSSKNIGDKLSLQFSANEINVLYIDFLREILFQVNTNFRYFYKIEINIFSNNKISMDCFYHILDIENVTQEIKAVTYHNIEINKEKDFYSALVTFDI
ncbi:MAG: archease, partial [Candidatus Cloacimonetes bacterium]|nr:archease [Candidatus Cloacimonadota bacterium]